MINHTEICEWLDERNPSVVVATDGSIRGDVTAWGGAVWRGPRRCFEWSTARWGRSSSYRAECEAFGDALIWISASTTEQDSVIVLTDSLSLVSRLEQGKVQDTWRPIIDQIEADVVAAYIPGHSGIKFNERADHLAGIAEPFGELVRSPADVLAEVKRKIEEQERKEQEEYWTVQRLQERGWKYGGGSRMTVRGRNRALVCQRELGVLTKGVLRQLIERGGSAQQPASLLLY